jgi:hypothetical protein
LFFDGTENDCTFAFFFVDLVDTTRSLLVLAVELLRTVRLSFLISCSG